MQKDKHEDKRQIYAGTYREEGGRQGYIRKERQEDKRQIHAKGRTGGRRKTRGYTERETETKLDTCKDTYGEEGRGKYTAR